MPKVYTIGIHGLFRTKKYRVFGHKVISGYLQLNCEDKRYRMIPGIEAREWTIYEDFREDSTWSPTSQPDQKKEELTSPTQESPPSPDSPATQPTQH